MKDAPCILFTAFEPSGDEHAAPVIAALRELAPQVPIYALGGAHMAEAGATLIESTCDRAAMGASALGKIVEHRAIRRRLRTWLDEHPVAIHVPTDSPAANWGLCKMTKPRGAKVVHLVAPQVWAWASWRVRRLQKWSDRVLCLLPFEPDWFARHDVDARFIGHPVFNEPIDSETMSWQAVQFPTDRPRLALLPGSRASEIRANYPIMLAACQHLSRDHSDLHTIVAAASETAAEQIRQMTPTGMLRLSIARDKTEAVLNWADAVLTVSGTASLHVARHAKPMVIMYRVKALAWHLLGRWLIDTRTFSLPNLIASGGPGHDASKHIVKEFIPLLHDDPQPIAAALRDILDDLDARRTQIDALKQITAQFEGHDAGREAAQAIAALLPRDKPGA